MTTSIEDRIVVAYCGDETRARAKLHGSTIIDQMMRSAGSVRTNWSMHVEIIFIHTDPLSRALRETLRHLKITTIHAERKVSAEFPIANKMLVGTAYTGRKDILFLDCDTIVHQPVTLDTSKSMLVAFDALQDASEETYRELYSFLGVAMPPGAFSEKPSYDYYYHDCIDQFPLLNTGVFFIKNALKHKFYARLEHNFHATYQLFKHKLTFYFDQICFALTMRQLELDFIYLPKGYNFICTKRAPFLKDWPKDCIVIEHYAGDNARPLMFNGNRIDLKKSGIT